MPADGKVRGNAAAKSESMSPSNAGPGNAHLSVIAERSADGTVVTVRLNRPAKRNALDRATVSELSSVLDRLIADPTIRALVLTGAGERAFCAGADLRERATLSPSERTAHTTAIADAADLIAEAPFPTIAAIRGFALAGGAELAIACDLRVASDDAIFGFPEVRLGIFPGAGGVLRLPALVGIGAARDLLFTGRRIDAHEAFRLRLIERLVPSVETTSAAVVLASEIAANAPLALRSVKAALADSVGRRGPDARRAIDRWRGPLDATADYQEGLTAFLEGRDPTFAGS